MLQVQVVWGRCRVVGDANGTRFVYVSSKLGRHFLCDFSESIWKIDRRKGGLRECLDCEQGESACMQSRIWRVVLCTSRYHVPRLWYCRSCLRCVSRKNDEEGKKDLTSHHVTSHSYVGCIYTSSSYQRLLFPLLSTTRAWLFRWTSCSRPPFLSFFLSFVLVLLFFRVFSLFSYCGKRNRFFSFWQKESKKALGSLREYQPLTAVSHLHTEGERLQRRKEAFFIFFSMK